MTSLHNNQKDIMLDNHEKNCFKYRHGNSQVHFHKGLDGKIIRVVRPAFIKIEELD